MRAGSFKISKNGVTAEVSITPLPGVSGIELESVNMWRQSLGLTPFTPEELGRNAESVTVGNRTGTLFDLMGSTNKNRIVGAVDRESGSLWFFKMTGEDRLVTAEKPQFREFLKSVTFSQPDESKIAAAPVSRRPMSANANQPSGADGKPNRQATWKLPAGWIEQPASSMLLASYLAQGKEGRKAEVSVSMFPGDVGGVLANVNRWRGQLGLKPLSESDLPQATSQIDVGKDKAVLVDMDGRNVRTGDAARMLAAIVPREGNTWFYKMMGDAAVITEQKQAFLEFAAGAH